MTGLHLKTASVAAAKETATRSAPIRMLVLEESPVDSQRILEELHATELAIEPTVARNCREFLDAIASQNFSLIVSAYRPRDWSALEALRASQEAGKQAPFIVISDEWGETEVEECLRHGVNDCVLKSQFCSPARDRKTRAGGSAVAQSEP